MSAAEGKKEEQCCVCGYFVTSGRGFIPDVKTSIGDHSDLHTKALDQPDNNSVD